MVYLDDGNSAIRLAIPAVSEQDARSWCVGNGDVVAIRDVTEEYQIDLRRVFNTLRDAGFSGTEMDYICRTLEQTGMAEYPI
jgi:hypothetical protein